MKTLKALYNTFAGALQTAIVALVFVTVTTTAVFGAGVTPRETAAIATDADEVERLDVTVKNGYIYITTSRAVDVRLYSILGQLVTRQQVQPGTTRIKAPSRGVYILKAGSLTRRVNVN